MGLRRTLERIRQQRAEKGLTIYDREKSTFGKVGVSEFTEQGIERPTVLGMRWLSFVGECLRQFGVCWAWRVSAERFEKDGHVSLYLQRVRHTEEQVGTIVAGAALVTPGTRKVPIGGAEWERYRVPVGLVNNHDTKSLIKLVLAPKEADVVLADSHLLRAIHGH